MLCPLRLMPWSLSMLFSSSFFWATFRLFPLLFQVFFKDFGSLLLCVITGKIWYSNYSCPVSSCDWSLTVSQCVYVLRILLLSSIFLLSFLPQWHLCQMNKLSLFVLGRCLIQIWKYCLDVLLFSMREAIQITGTWLKLVPFICAQMLNIFKPNSISIYIIIFSSSFHDDDLM